MGRELQKKKNRSSINKVKLKPKSKKINPLGNTIIAKNWNQQETLSQNYRRLGLTSRLNSATGGIEKTGGGSASRHPIASSTRSRLAISNVVPTSIEPTEARVERDETGKIVRVIHAKGSASARTARLRNRLDDPLNSSSEDEDEDEDMDDGGEEFEGFDTEQVESKGRDQELEEQASMIAEKKPRKQSQREQEWIERLVERYGDDTVKMARDRRLNPMQQTEADIGRRVRKWRSENSSGAATVTV